MTKEFESPVKYTKIRKNKTQASLAINDKRFTQAEVNKIVSNRLTRQLAKTETCYHIKLAEYEKLRVLEVQQKDAKIAELEAEINRYELETKNQRVLAKFGINICRKMLDLMVEDDFEVTQQIIQLTMEMDHAIKSC